MKLKHWIPFVSLLTSVVPVCGCDAGSVCSIAQSNCEDRCEKKYEDETSYRYKQCISGCEADYQSCLGEASDYD